jgi:hypothetical protein
LCLRPQEFDKETVIERCMIPMLNEVLLCLQENIIASAQEADMALVYGIGHTGEVHSILVSSKKRWLVGTTLSDKISTNNSMFI